MDEQIKQVPEIYEKYEQLTKDLTSYEELIKGLVGVYESAYDENTVVSLRGIFDKALAQLQITTPATEEYHKLLDIMQPINSILSSHINLKTLAFACIGLSNRIDLLESKQQHHDNS